MMSRQHTKHEINSVRDLRVPVYPYGTPHGPGGAPGRHAESDGRAHAALLCGRRSPRAAHHHVRTRAHDQIGPGGGLVRPRQRACRPKNGRLTTRRVRRRARSAAPRSARSAAAATRSGAAAPLPTCPAPLPSSCVDRTPAGPPRGTQRSAPTPTAGRSANRRRRIGENRARAAPHGRGRRPRSDMRRTPSRGGRGEADDCIRARGRRPPESRARAVGGRASAAFPAQSRGRKCKGYEFGRIGGVGRRAGTGVGKPYPMMP
jgi:hypothetical protein